MSKRFVRGHLEDLLIDARDGTAVAMMGLRVVALSPVAATILESLGGGSMSHAELRTAVTSVWGSPTGGEAVFDELVASLEDLGIIRGLE